MTDDAVAELISRRRRQCLVHSCLYYRMSTSYWTDAQFDAKARELRDLQKEYPEIASQCCWAEAFIDWDATTGFMLPLDDPWVVGRAFHIIKCMKGEV